MARTELTRRQHARAGNRYAGDLTDAEWALIAPLMPPRKATGRPRTTRLRDVFDAILCMAPTGCQWRMLPNDFPPVSTVRGDFHAWRDTGLLDEIDRKLVEAARVTGNRKSQPTAGIIDSQSVKTTESGGVSGDDAGKRIEGRKRHIATDTTGLLVALEVHGAGIEDRDGAPDVLKAVGARCPMLRVRPAHSDGSRSRSHLCRWRICGAKTARRPEGHRTLDPPDRQALRHRRRVRGPAPPVGGRAHPRLAGTMPPPVKGLGKIHRQRRGLDHHRSHPTRHTSSRKGMKTLG